MSTYPVSVPSSSFDPAIDAFVHLLGRLRSAGFASAAHDVVEQAVHAGGTEVLRLLFQGWLDERAAATEAVDVVGADGVLRTHHRRAKRNFECLFGRVSVERDRVGAHGVSSLVPLDGSLNLPADRFSFGVRERVCAEVLRGSFDAAVDTVESTTGAAVAKRQAEEVVLAAAVDFDAFHAETSLPEVADAEPSDLMVLTVDGKGVVMRPEGLRPATRKKAAASRHKLTGRLSKGEKRNRKRMATVAAVYELPAVARTPEEVLGELDGSSRPPRPRAQRKRVWASLVKTPKDVIGDAFREAAQRDPKQARRWVALVDGNATQIREITADALRFGVQVTLVLDLIHVTEYLWKAAWEFFDEGNPKAGTWVHKQLASILHGHSSRVAGAIRRAATMRRLDRRTASDAAANYLLGHRTLLRYDLFLPAGLPIATGVIEGACRHLVKDRMDITGARWGLQGAEAVLRLRSLSCSGDLPQYWAFHREKEFLRNHASSCADSERACLAKEAA